MEETDLGRCQALDSCLWEIQVSMYLMTQGGRSGPSPLQTLKSHYCPEVSELVSDLLHSLDKKSEEDIGKFLDKDNDDVILILWGECIVLFYSLDSVNCRDEAVGLCRCSFELSGSR